MKTRLEITKKRVIFVQFYLETETTAFIYDIDLRTQTFYVDGFNSIFFKFCIIFLDKLQQTFRRNCQTSGTFDFDDCTKFVVGRKGQQSSIFAGVLGRILKYLRLVLLEFFWITFTPLYLFKTL